MDVGNTTTAETNADMEGNTIIHPENVSEDNLKKDVKSNGKFYTTNNIIQTTFL